MRNIENMKRIVWLFCLCPLILSAQETDIFKLMLKESMKPEIPLNFSLNVSDSILFNPLFLRKPLRLDATKEFIPSLSFNYNENSLLRSFLEDYTSLKPRAISPYLLASFSNQEKDDSNMPETVGGVIVDVVVTPLASIVMINPAEFFNYLMQIGVLSDKPFVPKQSRKERMLKTITKDVYHIDDNY